MKRTLTCILSVFLFIQLGAQNPYFRPFGSSHDDVKNYLENAKHLNVDEIQDSQMIASTAHMKVEYSFREGYLWRVKMTRFLDDKRQADAMVQSLRNYYTIRKATIYDASGATKTDGAFHAETETEESIVSHHFGKKTFEVSLESLNEGAVALAQFQEETPEEKVLDETEEVDTEAVIASKD